MSEHLYPDTFRYIEQAVQSVNGRQMIQALTPDEAPVADGRICWAIVPQSAETVEVQSGRRSIDMRLTLEGVSALPQWSSEALGGLCEDVDAVQDAVDALAGRTFDDGSSVCSALSESWSMQWDGMVSVITMDITLRLERYVI